MILDDIVAHVHSRLVSAKQVMPLRDMIRSAEDCSPDRPSFVDALDAPGLSLICELKRCSPSKGSISTSYPYLEICQEYIDHGASALSVLTEPYSFGGEDRHLQDAATLAKIPILRKDFIVDEYQIYESKVLGASAVLLICALMDRSTLGHFLDIAHDLGLDALVEAHDEREVIMAVDSGARVIGVNNRDLSTFHVDIHNSMRLRHLVPRDRLFVSESGISTGKDARDLQESGTDAILVGEMLMRSTDRGRTMAVLRGDCHD